MLRKLALTAASLLAIVSVLEIIVRILGLGVHDFASEKRKHAEFQMIDKEGDYFYYPPNSRATFWGSVSSFNSLGLRDVEPARTKAKGTFRIVLLGDSVTAGEGVAQEAIFPYRLRESFHERSDVEVVAAGVSGWNTLEEERFLRANADRLDPDLVVLIYVMNDNEPVSAIRRSLAGELTAADRVRQALTLRSRLFEWMAFLYRKAAGPDPHALRLLAQWKQALDAAGPPFAPTDAGWIASRDAILRMRDLLRARGAELVVFLYDLGAYPAERAALERLQELARENAIRVFDMLPFFAGHRWQSIVKAPLVDPHPNAEGHALIADGIARTLVTERIVPSKSSATAASNEAPQRP